MPTLPLDQVVQQQAGSAAASKEPPEIIAGYRRTRTLGIGGMAVVYEAVHTHLDRKIALKLLKPTVADSADFHLRFLRESHAMAQVSHANVVGIYDAGDADGHLYMALEYVAGGDLARLVKRRGPLPTDDALKMMIGCARGLDAIHAAGLVHRDIKPANIFLDRDGNPKIGDLGLARAADGADRMTMTGNSWGTPSYMSPEQVKGVADIDIRSDIYALGATLYFLLTGTEPFSGETSFVITHRVLSEPSPDPRIFNQTIPPAVAAVVAKALTKDRAKRYTTPQELIEDLERARGGQRLLHTAASPAAAAALAPIAGALPRKGTTAATARVPTIDPFILKLLALLVVGGVLGLGWWSMQGFTVSTKTTSALPAWAADGGKDASGRWASLRVGSATAKLHYCPPGVFLMGSPALESGRVEAESQHQVTLTRGFWVADGECAQDLYDAVVGMNPSTHKGPRLPVDSVSWQEATDFCAALAKHGVSARLPTEAEWEYACRAGSTGAFAGKDANDGSSLGWMANGGLLQAWRSSSGDEAEAAAKRWCVQHADEPGLDTHQVATLGANAFGLSDLHGNVLEWCRDAWDGRSAYGVEPRQDPESTDGGLSVARGGCWFFPPERCRSATRLGLPATATLSYVGFRFVVPER